MSPGSVLGTARRAGVNRNTTIDDHYFRTRTIIEPFRTRNWRIAVEGRKISSHREPRRYAGRVNGREGWGGSMGAAMTPLEAAQKVQAEFPIANYVVDARVVGPFPWVGEQVSKLLPAGASILDFGAGPGDLSAVLAHLGYETHACDDLLDEWHKIPGNREKIMQFCAACGVKFEALEPGKPWPWAKERFDMVMIHHVLEHIHDSPRELMLSLVGLVKPRGYLFVTVPSAVNLRKRIAVLMGKTNMPPYGQVYWNEGTWRGHVREYTKDDLKQLAEFLELEVVVLESYHAILKRIPRRTWTLWRAATAVFPGWRDSWGLIARKPENWNPARAMKSEDPRFAKWKQPVWT